MSRTFAYCRVSTSDQNTSNQLLEITSAGFAVESHRAFEEVISGSIQARRRPGWNQLIERMEKGDVLVVTKLDRLGRSAVDVRNTVDELAERGIKVHCLALGGVDLTSAAGRMTMQVLSAVAEFERDLLIERTQAGLVRAKADGKKLGRPKATETNAKVQQLKMQKFTQSQVAAKLAVSLPTVKRHWKSSGD